MRNTSQGPLGFEGSDAPALQQLMETMSTLQAANEKAKAEQERLRAEVRVEQELL